jgi:molybdenum cofactor cytidylyltransferase
MQLVTGVLLAAGSGSRFGSDKRLALLRDGRSVLQHALEPLSAVCDSVLLVLGADDEEAVFLARFAGVQVFRSPRSRAGMGFSLADAAGELGAADACLVSLADKPFVRLETLQRVREALRGHALVVPTLGGEWGHPVGFGRAFFPLLRGLGGDRGARALIEQERDNACFVEIDDPGILADIDTPQQLDYWSSRLGPF